ncbi:transmembrane protein 174 [Thalassophryne amazonica]|uniref:transmembrane protein 174 n=1 Tax=Thalassophryne amazonica TaxID=390379 RepID=UPI0014714B1B|nr:transmembrane protein 174 [Thalassophryne amazonica]
MPLGETNSVENPEASIRGTPDDVAHTLPPFLPNPHQFRTDGTLDGKKTGAALLFSGLFLSLAGVTFTAMGWQHFQHSPNFEWTLLLGPILISVGGIFVLSSVCKFGIFSCSFCRQWEEEVVVIPVMEQTSAGHSFTVSSISQPIIPTTAVLLMPPPYNFVVQEVGSASEPQSGLPPQYDTVCYVENTASTAEVSSEPERTSHR